MLQVRLLGQFDVRRDGKALVISSRAAQSLLAYLLLTAGTAHRREKLAGLLWPETNEETARKNLRHELWRLRKALETKTPRKKNVEVLTVDEISIGFNLQTDYWLDVAVLQKATAEPGEADQLIETLSLYRGELLPGLYDDWVVLERERLGAVFELKMARLMELLIEAKRWQDILSWGEQWIALGQTPEPAYRALMIAHGASGNVAQVAAVYERCVRAMRDDLGVEPSEQTRTLFERLSKNERIDETAAPRASPPAVPKAGRSEATGESIPALSYALQLRSSSLPVPLTSFIGREREIEELKHLLSSTRLLTLTGSGGVGKTRMAIRLARDLQNQYKDGARWVDLVALADPSLVPQAVAKAMGVLETPNVPLMETLSNALRSMHVLLVLDNCEHLIVACAGLAEFLLGASGSVKILATSRETLGISVETTWRVPSLSLPDPHHSATTANLNQYEGVRLFVERARAVKTDFTLTEQNAQPVIHICQRLDGIPLAIELAAARTKLLSPGEIEKRLDDRFGLLTTGSRTALPRQQTLRAAIDWSHELLSAPERTLFRRLSGFAGGFTLSAAEEICRIEEIPVLQLLGQLVDKSLVTVDSSPAEGETRYGLLETIREYAREKLIEAGEERVVRDRHMNWFARLAGDAEPEMLGSDQVIWFNRLDTELDNLRAAMDWSMENDNPNSAMSIVGTLSVFWYMRGHYNEATERSLQVISSPLSQSRTSARAKALNTAGFMQAVHGQFDESRIFLEEALAIGRELAHKPAILWSLFYLGFLSMSSRDLTAAREYFEAGLALAGELGPAGRGSQGYALTNLADVFSLQDDADRALVLYERAAAMLREAKEKSMLGYSLRRLGQFALVRGDHQTAVALNKQSLELNTEVGEPRGVIACLAGFAGIAAARGQAVPAARLYGAVEALLHALAVPNLPTDQRAYDQNVAALRSQLDEATFSEAWTEGRAMTTGQAIAYASSVLDIRQESAPVAPNNLPVPLSSFVGRGKEISEIKRLMTETRLLTLIGAGGVGKTRLALRVATDMLNAFKDGVRWVDLAALTDGALVPQSVAAALGVRDEPNSPLRTNYLNHLGSMQLLLVLDNCEHLVDACARLCTQLLGSCSNLRILTTSREALGITGEMTWRVPSLSLPDAVDLPPLEKLNQYEGVQLFVDRAHAVKTDFALVEQNALPLVQICQRLDGIPLAIELAAARVKALSVSQIATRLDDRFRLLTQGSRTALMRHQTLRATIDWSYDLLPEQERILFCRLSAFVDGWTLEAAEGVVAGYGLEQSQVLDLLARLVDKSIVLADERGSAARYRMLETIRQYAFERLSDSGETDAIRRRHLEFFVKLAEEAEPKLFSVEQIVWLDRLEAERGNLRGAVEWALATGRADAGLRIASALLYFWYFRGPYREGLEWLRQFLSVPQLTERTLARARALNAMGFLYWGETNSPDPRAQLEEALSIGLEIGDRLSVATSMRYLGMLANMQGDYAEAHSFLEQSMAIGRELGKRGEFNNGEALNFLGDVALNEGQYARAQVYFEESVAILRETKDRNIVSNNLRRLGLLASHRGDLPKAAEYFKESLNLNTEVGDRRAMLACISALGGIAVAHGQAVRAARLFGAVQALLDDLRIQLLQTDAKEYNRNLAALRANMSENEFASAWAEGSAMTMERVLAYAVEPSPVDSDTRSKPDSHVSAS